MKAMRFLLLLSMLGMAGCASQQKQDLQDWASANKPLAESGQIKWSDYYKEIYKRVSAIPSQSGKAENLEWANLLIQASLLYESGALDKEGFDAVHRSVEIDAERQSAQRGAASRQAMSRALQNISNSYGAAARSGVQAQRNFNAPGTPANPYTCRNIGAEVTCSSQF